MVKACLSFVVGSRERRMFLRHLRKVVGRLMCVSCGQEKQPPTIQTLMLSESCSKT